MAMSTGRGRAKAPRKRRMQKGQAGGAEEGGGVLVELEARETESGLLSAVFIHV